MSTYSTRIFPKSRIATIDVCEIGRHKHHVAAFLEFDVTDGASMARFISSLTKNAESGLLLGEAGAPRKSPPISLSSSPDT